MKRRTIIFCALAVVTGAALLITKPWQPKEKQIVFQEEDEESRKEQKARFHLERVKYEFDLLKDPATGRIPEGIREKEIAFALQAPERRSDYISAPSGTNRTAVLNNYIPAGPNNIGGRTRAVEYDRRFNGTSNRVIIAGCVSGGIMRSTDGGNTWTLVTPQNDIHNFTALAQDPRPGFENTWYAGGGEALGNTAGEVGAFYLGFGLWKSVDNGATWTKLPMNVTDNNGNPINAGTLEAFNHPFDIVHRIAVSPLNGEVYVAGQTSLSRSTDGGNSFQIVFGTLAGNTRTGQTDVTISNTGRIFLCVNGGNPSMAQRGVWVSGTGNTGSFTRIAGGQTINVDSVPGWRGNITSTPGSTAKRIIMRLAPSNNNIAYVFYENGLSSDPVSSGGDLAPEGDLFRLNISGNTYTWSNRSANLPDIAGGDRSGSDPLSLQGGYNMEVAIKPDNPDVVFIGGTNLYRSTDGFATSNNTTWIGGYNINFTYNLYPNSHPDIHRLVFNPSNPNRAICGNDGGVQETADITAASVTWAMLPNYQTLQCYNVALDPTTGQNNFASGSQDNGVRFRDKTGLLGTPPADSNNHRPMLSADGAYVGISSAINNIQYIYESIQFGRIIRAQLTPSFQPNFGTDITPTGLTTSSPDETTSFGDFVTNLRLELDNSNTLYYVNFNRLFRTTSASTVTPSTWTELTGVSSAVNPSNATSGRDISIRGMGYSRGPATTSQVLYFGTTNGKIFRLDNARNAPATQTPINITPSGLTGNVQDIAVNPNNDDEVIAVVSNYNTASIWWTRNGKSASPTWRNAEGNLTTPSVRSCAIVVKKDAANQPVTEYYVGTSVGLYSTANLGTVLEANQVPQWQREGGYTLNYAVVTSLSYRPSDNVLLVGTHGNGIFYTFLGTPNFTPNQNTSVPPVTNDRSFVRAVYPTVSRSNNVQYQIGNLPGLRRINVQLVSLSGQVVYQENRGYQNGSIPMNRLSAGVYVLHILSDDNKYRHVQKIVKQ